MQKITPFLWFNDSAEQAVEFYMSIFKHAKVTKVTRYGDGGPGPKGSVMTIAFELHGQEFVALNGGPQFNFSPAISFVVNCDTQAEVDDLWEKLSTGGQRQQCGWLQDRYGISWQIVPRVLPELVGDEDPAKANRVMKAMMQMTKLDVKALIRAAESS